jgi:hypothetical protein
MAENVGTGNKVISIGRKRGLSIERPESWDTIAQAGMNILVPSLPHPKTPETTPATPHPAGSAVLPRNAGRYLSELLSGTPRWLALLKTVALPEQWRILLQPAKFDRDHGEPDKARARFIAAAFGASWAPLAVYALAAAAGALSLGVAGLVLSFAAGNALSVALHVLHDRGAALPLAFLVAKDGSVFDGSMPAGSGYAPLRIHRMPDAGLTGEAPRNTGIRAAGRAVWARRESGMLTLYVTAEPGEEFVLAAAEVIGTLKGYANVQGAARYVQLLTELGGRALESRRAVVFNYTSRPLRLPGLYDVPVLSGDRAREFPAWDTVLNVHNATRFAAAPEIGVERAWADELAEIPSLNLSLFLNEAELRTAGKRNVRLLQARGAKVYAVYRGTDGQEALRLVNEYGTDGIVCTDRGIPLARVAAAVHQRYPDMPVAGEQPSDEARPYVELRLDDRTFEADVRQVKPGSVVKVRLGKHCTMERVLQLNNLPPSCILVFEGEEFKEESISRDMTELVVCGTSLFELLRLVPQTPEQKAAYQRTVAYRLTMDEFEDPSADDAFEADIAALLRGDFDAIRHNRTFIAAVRLYLLDIDDGTLRQAFLNAVAERLRARRVLARAGKTGDLEDVRLEMLLGGLLERGNAGAANAAVLKRFSGLGNATEVESELFTVVSGLKRRADQGDPEAAATIVELIRLYAGERNAARLDRESLHTINMDTSRRILEAA